MMLGSISVRGSVDHRATRARRTAAALGNTGGGRHHTVTMCQTEIAAAKTNSASRARSRCTAPELSCQGQPVQELLSRSTQYRYPHDSLFSASSRHAREDSFLRRSLRDGGIDPATSHGPHLRVSIRERERPRERVATYPARISWSTVAIVRDASQSVSGVSSFSVSLTRRFFASRTHTRRGTATHSRDAVTQFVVSARENSIEKKNAAIAHGPQQYADPAVGESTTEYRL